MEATQKEFIEDLVGAVAETKAFEKRENEKRALLESVFGGLTPSVKDSIREGMSFQVVDKRGKKHESSFSASGQEHAVDTFGSTKKGRGISAEDQPKVQAAMDAIVELTRKALDKKRADGKPLFESPDELEVEVFTPLVREGLLPETFVLDQFSEVQKLLNATFKGYKETTKAAQKQKEADAAKLESDYHGAGGKLDMLKGLGGKLSQRKDMLLDKLPGDEDTRRIGGIMLEGAQAAGAWITAGMTVDKMASGELVDKMTTFMNTDDDAHTVVDQATRAKPIRKALGAVGMKESDINKVIETINLRESNPAYHTESSLDLASDLVGDVIDIAEQGYDLSKINDALGKARQGQEVIRAVRRAVTAIDGVLETAVSKASPAAGAAIGGLYKRHVDLNALESAAELKSVDEEVLAVDGREVLAVLSGGFRLAMESASPTPLDPTFSVFSGAGRKMADECAKGPSAAFGKAVLADPSKGFEMLVSHAKKAVAAGVTGELTKLLADPATVRQLAVKSVIPDEEAALEALERSEEEIREYERALVLIDEGGVTAAEQRSIESLIQQLNKDRQVIGLVTQIGSSIEGLGSSATGIAAWASEELTDQIAGSIVGPLKAAKLIMQLAINVKNAAERWSLWYKFKTDLERSRIAVSSLSSSIEGFYNNKKEQIAFHTIEDALMVVEIAAAILGSVPEPFTLALGKTMGAVASAAQQTNKVAGKLFNEGMLIKAWATTRAAMNNPRDRALGLKALRLSPTLGMHAIAWAGMEKSPADPIARMVLSSVGLNEQTLAAGGTESKVRDYLTTLLYEDRSLIDPAKLKTDWAPQPLTLCVKDWFSVTTRAAREATPKLRKSTEQSVLNALKLTDQHKPVMGKLQELAKKGEVEPKEMDRIEAEGKALCDTLDKYNPVATDGSSHDDMGNVVAEFMQQAKQHYAKLRAIGDINKAMRDPSRAFNVLNEELTAMEFMLKEEEHVFEKIQSGLVLLEDVKKIRDDARAHYEEIRAVKAFAKDSVLQQKLKQLGALLKRADRKIAKTD